MTEQATEDAMRQCSEAIVKVPEPWGLVIFIMDIFLPGVGTIFSSCFGEPVNTTALCYGILQLATCWLLIGWLWSIYHGWRVYEKSKE